MNAKCVKFLSAFIPGERRRWAFRNRRTLIRLSAENDIRIAPEDVGRCRLSIVGKNNVVHVGRLKDRKGVLDIRIFGDGNEVRIGEGVAVAQSLLVVAGQDHTHFGPVTGCRVSVGDRTTIESATCITYNSGAVVEIGSDCMFSYGIMLYQTDGHPVLECATGKVVNRVGTMHIGNHVWVGGRAVILKNTSIPDDCIVGFGSVVSGRFGRSHSAIAGNPAREVTAEGREITWCAGNPDYIRNGISGKGGE